MLSNLFYVKDNLHSEVLHSLYLCVYLINSQILFLSLDIFFVRKIKKVVGKILIYFYVRACTSCLHDASLSIFVFSDILKYPVF